MYTIFSLFKTDKMLSLLKNSQDIGKTKQLNLGNLLGLMIAFLRRAISNLPKYGVLFIQRNIQQKF